jgi:tetratricopeptide (TPR) repeat protein
MLRPRRLPWICLGLAAGILSGCTKALREERAEARADRSLDAGRYDQAEAEYRKALELEPADAKVIGKLGLLYAAEGRTVQAFPFLRKAAELDPGQTDVQVKLGLANFELGATKEAREAAKRALAVDPANEDALLLLAESGRTKAAADETRQLIAGLHHTHPDCAGYHLALGVLLLDQGDQAGAEAELRVGIGLNPGSASAFYELGNVFALRRDAAQTGKAFQTSAQLAPLRSTLRLRYVDFLLATNRADEAKKVLAQMTGGAPDYIPAQVYEMKLALAEQRDVDCAAWIEKILQRDPRNYEALMERSALKMAQGDPAGAEDELTKAEGVYGRSPQIKYQLALAYLRNNDLAKAEDRLDQALVLEPGFDQAKLLLAEVELRKGNPAIAIASLNGIVQRHPQLNLAYRLLARAYLAQNSPDQALETYRRMGAAFPRDPQVPYFIGLLQTQQNRREEARASFEQALQIAPNFGPAMDMLMNADLTEGRVDAAAVRSRGLIEKYPKSAGPWLLQAKVDLVRKNLEATESDLDKAIELDPKGQAAYVELVDIYLRTHKTEQAIEKLAALAQQTHSPRTLMQLAVLQTSLGKFEAARDDYQQLLAIDPKFGPALNNLAYLESEHLNQLDLAYDLAKRARDVAPEDPDTADTLGWILYRKGDYHGALDLVAEGAQKEPDNAASQYHLGMIHYRLGEEDQASQAFQHAIAAKGVRADAPAQADARQRLALLALDPAAADQAAVADLETRAKADPNDPVVLTRLAAVEARSGSAAEAAARYQTLLNLTPRNPRPLLDLAQLYAGPLHDPDQARALAKRAHELAPDDAPTSEMLGRLLYRTGDYQWSMDLLEAAARSRPEERGLQYDLALAQYSVGRLTDAEQTLSGLLGAGREFPQSGAAKRFAALVAASKSPASSEAARAAAVWTLGEDPSSLPALMVNALALEQEGDSLGAGAAYEKILAQDPVFSPAARRLALIDLTVPGKEQRAYELALKAREAFPDDPEVAMALGIGDYRRADYSGATRLLQEGLKLRPSDGEAIFYLGLCHFQAKNFSDAKSELNRALGSDLAGPDADRARNLLDQMARIGTGAASSPSN